MKEGDNMSCLYRIKEARNMMTDTEAKLADYILDHHSDILNDSAQVLAKKTDTSAAAIIRFAKKIGFKGFSELKLELAKESGGNMDNFTEQIHSEDSIHTLIHKTKQMNLQVIDQTYYLMNETTMEEAVNALRKAHHIYLFGVGSSSIVCDDLLHKLLRIGKFAIHHHDTHFQMTNAINIEKEDVALGISYSGKTKEVITAMRHAKENGATTIGITQLKKSPLSRYCDILLYIPTEETEVRIGAISSRTSCLIITDLLYLAIARDNLEETHEYLLRTREIVKDFKS